MIKTKTIDEISLSPKYPDHQKIIIKFGFHIWVVRYQEIEKEGIKKIKIL